MTASAALARGRVSLAEGDLRAATTLCEEAVGAWSEVGAPYETALARMVLAEAHRGLGHEDRARLELRAARSTFERIGATSKAQAAGAACGDGDPAAPPPVSSAGRANVFAVEGDTRSVVYEGHAVRIRDLKGMRYLARLLAEPGREFHVLDLVAAERGAPVVPDPRGRAPARIAVEGDLGPVLDAQAKAAYRRRLQDIDDDIEEATRMGDGERVALAEADRDYIVRELSRAFGLGGGDRHLGSSSERARASVTRAVRYALDRLAAHHRVLADHLKIAVRTGTYCSYVPDARLPVRWTV